MKQQHLCSKVISAIWKSFVVVFVLWGFFQCFLVVWGVLVCLFVLIQQELSCALSKHSALRVIFLLPDHCTGVRWVLESCYAAGDTPSKMIKVTTSIQETPRLPKAPLHTITTLEHGLLAQEETKATLFYLHPLEPAPQSCQLSVSLRPAIFGWVPSASQEQLLANPNSQELVRAGNLSHDHLGLLPAYLR